jgi:hypothetical protein
MISRNHYHRHFPCFQSLQYGIQTIDSSFATTMPKVSQKQDSGISLQRRYVNNIQNLRTRLESDRGAMQISKDDPLFVLRVMGHLSMKLNFQGFARIWVYIFDDCIQVLNQGTGGEKRGG